jgi:hypothetical protein
MRQKWAVALVVIGFVVIGAGALAQAPSEHEQHHPGAPQGGPGKMGMGMMGEKCAMMQKGMDDMETKMRDAHAKLDQLVHEMNTTTGPAKVDSMAAVINEIASQSEEMHRMHTEMMQKMMTHMTEHMMQGMGPQAMQKPEMKEMMMCPMMKGHGAGGEHGKSEAAPDEHADHGAQAAPDEHQDHATPPAAPDADEHAGHHPPQN